MAEREESLHEISVAIGKLQGQVEEFKEVQNSSSRQREKIYRGMERLSNQLVRLETVAERVDSIAPKVEKLEAFRQRLVGFLLFLPFVSSALGVKLVLWLSGE